MTGKYTHGRPETLREQILQALRRWPAPLLFAAELAGTLGHVIAGNSEAQKRTAAF